MELVEKRWEDEGCDANGGVKRRHSARWSERHAAQEGYQADSSGKRSG